MITKISKLYMDKIEELAKEFAHNHAKQYRDFSYTRTYNATVKAYRNFGIFFYIATNKLSFSNRDFRFNHIFVKAFTILSNRLYKKILTHLEKNKIIRINNHYMIGKTSPDKFGFPKSYLLDWDLIKKMDEQKSMASFKCIDVEIPVKVMMAMIHKEIQKPDFEEDKSETLRDSVEEHIFNSKKMSKNIIWLENILKDQDGDKGEKYIEKYIEKINAIKGLKGLKKLNATRLIGNLRDSIQKVNQACKHTSIFTDYNNLPDFLNSHNQELPDINQLISRESDYNSFYTSLNFDPKSLEEYCKKDDLMLYKYYRILKKLPNEASFKKDRYYHAFHQLPHEFREKVLRFNRRKTS